jgi:hypothetical protein
VNVINPQPMLKFWVEQYSLTYFDGLVPTWWAVRVRARPRRRKTLAYFRHPPAGRALLNAPELVFFADFVLWADEVLLRQVVLHELTHAWLFAKGLPCGHTPAFKKKLYEAYRHEFDGIRDARSCHTLHPDAVLKAGQLELAM